MITISLCMIVKNEEDVIGRCLETVCDIVDEINIVDTGSTDRTKDIVSSYTNRIFDFSWVNDFAAARNYSFNQATKDYILWLDADDVIQEPDQRKLLHLKETLNQNIESVSMNYHLAFDEEQNVTTSIRRNRLVKRENDFLWIGSVHEYLAVHGIIHDSDIAVTHLPLTHDANRNLGIYEKMLSEEKEFSPRDLFYYANELLDHSEYKKAIEYYLRFLRTKKGWVEDNIRACNKLADCYHQFNLKEQEAHWALKALSYGIPQPETCCRLGFLFLEKNEIQSAIYWYEQSLENKETDKLSFQNNACSSWLPHLQLAVCYDRLGQYQLASKHNESALLYRPNDPRMLANKEYFDGLTENGI